jgi:hypothetical protein
MRISLEPLTYQYGVDVFFYGKICLQLLPHIGMRAIHLQGCASKLYYQHS